MTFDFDSLPQISLFLLQANLVWAFGCAVIFLALKSTPVRHRYPIQLALLFILPISSLVALGINLPGARTITEPLTVNLYTDTTLHEAVIPPVEPSAAPTSHCYVRIGIAFVSVLAFIGFSLLAVGFWHRLRRLLRLAGETHPGVQSHLNELADGLGVKQRIRLFIAKLNISPFSYGIGKPRIVIPDKLLQVLSSNDVDLVLRHEIHHIQRGDFLVNILQKGIRIAFFYNPLVHWLDRRIELDREFLCDRAVLESSQCSKREYAELLVRVAEFVNQHPNLSPQVTFHSKQTHLRKRLSNMKTNHITHPTPWRTGFTLFTLLASFIAVSLTGYGADGEKKKQKKAKKEKFTLEISNDELTIRRNGEAHRFEKDSEEYRALMAQYKRLLRQVEPVTSETDHKRPPNESARRAENPFAVASQPPKAPAQKIRPARESRSTTKQIRRYAPTNDAFAESHPHRQGQRQQHIHQYSREHQGQGTPFQPRQSQNREAYREKQILIDREREGKIRNLESRLAQANTKLARAQGQKNRSEDEYVDATSVRRLEASDLAKIQDRQRRALAEMERELAEQKQRIERQHKLLEQQLKRQQDELKRELEDRQDQFVQQQKKLQDELHKKAAEQQRRAYERDRQLENEARRAAEHERRARDAELEAKNEARQAIEHERRANEEQLRARAEMRRALDRERRTKEEELRARDETLRALETARRAKEQDLKAKRHEDRMARLRQELVEANVIDPAGDVLNIELSDKHLKVNGKVQSKALHRRAKQIFGNTSDQTVNIESKTLTR